MTRGISLITGFDDLVKTLSDAVQETYDNIRQEMIQVNDVRTNAVGEVKEYDDRAEIEIELPGVAISEVEIKVDKKILTIIVDQKATPTRKSYYKMKKSVCLSDNVIEKNIFANLKSGILTVTLPKNKVNTEKDSPKTIKIQGE